MSELFSHMRWLIAGVSALVGVPAHAASGELYVSSSTPGAQIHLDGQDTGERTPSLLSGLAPGAHTLQVIADCQGATAEVEVQADRITRAELSLTAATGGLLLTVSPEAARPVLMLDGQVRGEGRGLELESLRCGEHLLQVRAPGFIEHSQDISIRPFSQTTATVVLVERLLGTLVVAPVPLEARVFLDGAPIATGPVTVDSLDIGDHELKVSLDGYLTSSSQVSILPEQIHRVDVQLEPVSTSTTSLGSDPRPAWQRASVGRLTANTIITAGGVGLSLLSVQSALNSDAAYQRYLTTPSSADAEKIYAQEVIPWRRWAIASGIGGGSLVVGGAMMWVSTDFTAESSGVVLRGIW